MSDIRKHIGVLWVVMVLTQLSFLFSVPTVPEMETLPPTVCGARITALADRETMPMNDTLALPGSMVDHAAMREEQGVRMTWVRFWLVAVLPVIGVCCTYRSVVWRFCARMIRLWRDIYYIHRIDGKKKYFCSDEKLRGLEGCRRNFLWKKTEYVTGQSFC